MLGVHCFRGGHELCDLWPLCDCDCHAEKKLEPDLLAGKLSVERVHERMMSRRYSREWRRAQRGTDPLHKKSGRARGKVCKRCGYTHDGEFAQCDSCNERLRVSRSKSKEKKTICARRENASRKHIHRNLKEVLMQVITKRRFQIILDEDEAEEFLDDATDVQSKVRAQLYAPKENGHIVTAAATERAPMERVLSPVPAKRGRPSKQNALLANARMGDIRTRSPKVKPYRSPQPVACPECGAKMDPRGLPTHRRKLHGSDMSAAARDADGSSVE